VCWPPNFPCRLTDCLVFFFSFPVDVGGLRQSDVEAEAAADEVFVQFDHATVAYRKDVPLDDPEAQEVRDCPPLPLVVLCDVTFVLVTLIQVLLS
jgi:hypothetical protein